MRLPLPSLAAALATLALAGPAQAATTFDLGPGVHPDVATDTTGTGHFVWDQVVPGVGAADTTVYCRVPRGATACARTHTFPLPLDTIGRSSYVFTPSPGRVIVISSRCCDSAENDVYAMESSDGGETFSAPKQIGTADPESNAFVSAGGSSIFAGDISTWQEMPLSGGASSQRAQFNSGQNIPTSASAALHGTGTRVVAISEGDTIAFFYWDGLGDVNNAATWTGPTNVGAGFEPHLAGGPAGTAMIYTAGEPGKRQLVARSFDGTAFSAPVPVSEIGDPIFADLNANPQSGELTAFWVDNRTPNEWRIARSKDGGLTWTDPIVLLRGDAADGKFALQVSLAPDQKGFVVTDQQSGGHVIAAPAEPLIEKPEVAGTPETVATTTIGGLELGLIAPTSCITPPQKIALRVTSKVKKKLSPDKRVKITVAVFSVDKKKVTDKKAAFKGIFSTAGFAAGSKHPLKAVVKLKPLKGNGKTKTKTLKGTLTICG